tara:strand:- start:594 stop:1079 length:486 start_codon:yes stop_codon:yes gene_type:complete
MPIGNDAYYNALKKREKLKREIDALENFIRQCEQLAKSPDASIVTGTYMEQLESYDRLGKDVTGKGRLIREACKKAISDARRPLQRIQLIEAVENQGIEFGVLDKANYLGTLMWRAKDEFVNLKYFGYWLRHLPFPEAKYEPSDPQSEQSMTTPASCDVNH